MKTDHQLSRKTIQAFFAGNRPLFIRGDGFRCRMVTYETEFFSRING